MTTPSPTPDFRESNRRFERRLTLVTSATLAVAAISVALTSFGGRFSLATVWGAFIIGGLAILTLLLTLTNHDLAAKRLLFVGGHGVVCLATIIAQTVEPITAPAMIYFTSIAAFIISPRFSLWMIALSLVTMAMAVLPGTIAGPADVNVLATAAVSAISFVAISIVMVLFAIRSSNTISQHHHRLEHNERLFQQVPHTAGRLGAAASQLNTMSQQQRRDSFRQQSAIEEILASMKTLRDSSSQISDASQRSLASARSSYDNSLRVSQEMSKLSDHVERITSILDRIKELSNKSELLALNASLEGTKAGKYGKGFSLVANQMQGLAESIAAAATDIRVLTQDIHQSTASTQQTTGEATKLAERVTSEAEQINGSVLKEKASVDQIVGALDEIATISANVSHGTTETTASSEELAKLAEQLTEMVEKFRSAAESAENSQT